MKRLVDVLMIDNESDDVSLIHKFPRLFFCVGADDEDAFLNTFYGR